MRLSLLVLLAACGQDYGVTQQQAQLTVDPTFYDAGVVAVGATAGFEIEMFASRGDVSVLSVDVLAAEGDGFAIDEAELPVVEKDGSAVITGTYSPSAVGFHWAAITVLTDEARENRHEVQVRGQGAQAAVRVLPPLVDFGPTDAGDTSIESLSIANESDVDLVLESLDFDDPRFDTRDDAPLAVPGGETVSVGLTFTPSDASEVFGSLSLAFDATLDLDPVDLQGNACSVGSGDLYDADDDGFSWCSTDCDDSDAEVNPGGRETCNGKDDDCDGTVDEETSCSDDDGDGWSEDDGDCNDGDASVSPSETEVADNGIDDDCDGTVDDGALDADGDGYSTMGGDCDDDDASVFPGGPETADGKDNDCDGKTDEGTEACDDDRDGYTEDAGDCDDSDDDVYSGATEEEDWIDNDCDGTVDEGTDNYDDDGDGFTENGGDCKDSDASINPGAEEVEGDGKDNDCDGVKE